MEINSTRTNGWSGSLRSPLTQQQQQKNLRTTYSPGNHYICHSQLMMNLFLIQDNIHMKNSQTISLTVLMEMYFNGPN